MASGMRSGKLERVEQIPFYAQVTWFLFDLLMPTTFLVFVLYLVLVVDWNDPPTHALSYLTHGANFLLMVLDAFLSNKPYYLLHGIYFFLFAATYALWTYIYYLLDGTDCDGNPYIYAAFDWGADFDGTRRISGFLVFVVAPFVNFMFWLAISFCFPGQRPSPEEPVETNV
jgi:hypothetical protein